ncbi:hypothetical protein Hamer_G003246 [Homarus americanus]|uniref:Uncharacterized protein n=1 Tax=Homarus americanus TaxID=6706 RepID=A0A8J5N750_HOMAM|nr:hypothetical protein Hamer_G003246 [Homarus americanus]
MVAPQSRISFILRNKTTFVGFLSTKVLSLQPRGPVPDKEVVDLIPSGDQKGYSPRLAVCSPKILSLSS